MLQCAVKNGGAKDNSRGEQLQRTSPQRIDGFPFAIGRLTHLSPRKRKQRLAIAGLDNFLDLGEKDAHLAEPEPGYGWEVFLAERPCRSLVPGKGGKVATPKLYTDANSMTCFLIHK